MGQAETDRFEFLTQMWRNFAEHEAGPYSPLYAAIGRTVAADPQLVERILEDFPPHAHMPIFFLAAVHDLVLRGTDDPLGRVYADHDVDAAPTAFLAFVDSHWDAIVDLLQRRRVQTNECGRSAVIALALAKAATLYGPPAVLLDAGASAGLNLLYDRFHLDYGVLGSLGEQASSVHVACEVRTPEYVLPPRVPAIATRIGIDREPIDVTNEDDRRWLLACVWPDTGRLERTADALDLAVSDPPDVRRGDMVTDVAPMIDALDGDGVVCVMTSWAAGYLSARERDALAASLDDVGTRREVWWLSLEGPGVVDLFDVPDTPGTFEVMPSVVGIARFHQGARDARALAHVHPHGHWLAWV